MYVPEVVTDVDTPVRYIPSVVSVIDEEGQRAYHTTETPDARFQLWLEAANSTCGLTQWIKRYEVVLPGPALKLAQRLQRLLEQAHKGRLAARLTRQAWRGEAWIGRARLGGARQAGLGPSRLGTARKGAARQA